MSLNANISLNSILNTATSGLQVSQAALRVTSNNIANVNTEGYHRRVVDFGPRLTGDRLTGVAIEDVRRVADSFLARETIDSTSAAGKLELVSTYFNRVQDLIGSLDGNSSLDARLSSAMTALQQLSVDPSSVARRNSALSAVTSALSAISNMATNVQRLRQDSNTQLSADVTMVNGLLSRIYDLNKSIKIAAAAGDRETILYDQRDKAISDLAKYVDIRTFEQSDGRMFVSLGDGTSLISDYSAEFRYQGPSSVTTSTSFPSLTLQKINPEGPNDVGSSLSLEDRIRGGEIRGLIDMRDKHLPDLAEQLGLVGASLAEQLNAAHNNASSVPPQATLTGTQTGLLATDALNFTGFATVAVTDAQGALMQQVSLDLSTLPTVDDLVNAINTGLFGSASAVFSNGVLSIIASNPGEGVAMLQDPANPADRGGRGLSHFFGLNNLVTASSPSSFATGVAAGDAHNFTPGGVADFVLRGQDGSIIRSFSLTVGGATVADIVSDLNLAAGSAATFGLDGDGKLTMTPAAGYTGARLEVKNDATDRSGTGVSLSQFFGLGTTMRQNQAMSMSVRSDIALNGANLALAQLDVTGSSVSGDIVLGMGDNRGAQALAEAATRLSDYSSAGGLAAGRMSLNDYVTQVLGMQSDLSNSFDAAFIGQMDVKEEVIARRNALEGVNMDEELANMMIYQQAYNAAARMITVVQEMFDELMLAV